MENIRHIDVQDDNTRVEFHNGTTFITRKVSGAPKFSIAALIEAGSYDDLIPGTAHFFEHLPFAQTENFEDAAVFSYMAEREGSIGAYTVRDRTVYHGEVKKGSERDAILAISDLLCRPVLNKRRVSNETETILDEWAYNEMDATRHYYQALIKAAYGNNPTLHPIIGTDETIRQIDLATLERFYKDNYFADRLIVAMEGDFEHAQVMDWAKKKFQLPRGPRRPKLQLTAIDPHTHVLKTDQRATKTSIIVQSRPSVETIDVKVSGSLLGSMLFDVSGPLMREMRFGKRLVYGIGIPKGASEYTTNYAFDAITFDAFPPKVPAALQAMGHAIGKFFRAPNEKLFNEVKASSTADIIDGMRRKPEIGAQEIAYTAYALGSVSSAQAWLDAYQNAELSEVVALAAKHLGNGRASVVYMGQHRDDFLDHEGVATMLRLAVPIRTAETSARVIAHDAKPGDQPRPHL